MIEREFVVRFKLPKSLRRRWVLATTACVLLLSAGAWATVPHLFNAGDLLSATKLNENFNGLDERVALLESSFCGTTSNIVDARLAATNGYATASTLCQGVVGCGSTAHMCTSSEMLRYTAAGNGNTKEGWLATGVLAFTPGGSAIDDCNGFTSNSGSAYGTTWAGFLRTQKTCNTATLPILCCD